MSEAADLPVKEQALRLVQALPEDASWDELMYRIYVRQAIEAGLEDADAGRVVDTAEVRRQFGLAP
jgi:predicted transcriptional regulator